MGVATEGHPYKLREGTNKLRRFCRGGPLWPPHSHRRGRSLKQINLSTLGQGHRRFNYSVELRRGANGIPDHVQIR